MTVREFYNWCKKRNYLDNPIEIGYDIPGLFKTISDTDDEYNVLMDDMCIVKGDNLHVLHPLDATEKITLF